MALLGSLVADKCRRSKIANDDDFLMGDLGALSCRAGSGGPVGAVVLANQDIMSLVQKLLS